MNETKQEVKDFKEERIETANNGRSNHKEKGVLKETLLTGTQWGEGMV